MYLAYLAALLFVSFLAPIRPIGGLGNEWFLLVELTNALFHILLGIVVGTYTTTSHLSKNYAAV